MDIIQDRRLRSALRMLSLLFIAIILLMYICTYFLTNSRMHLINTANAQDGAIDLSGYSQANSPPVQLKGSWEFFPGRLATEESLHTPELWNSHIYAALPAVNIASAESRGSYRLLLTIDDFSSDGYVLYLPNLKSKIDVFVNGVLCPTLDTQSGWAELSPFSSTYYVGQFDAAREQQEIVVSANFGAGDTAFFKRAFILGSPNNVLSFAYLTLAGELLSFGAIVLIMLTAFIFMFFLPDHKLMTLIAIFDTLLMLRVVFGLDSVMELFSTLFNVVFDDSTLFSIQIFLLMLSGAAGAVLAHHLFDPVHAVPNRFTLGLPVAYLVLAVLFPARLDWFDAFGVPVILALFLYTFLLVFWQIIGYWKREKGPYAVFQIIKTVFIGVVIFFDLFSLKRDTSFLPFSYLYLMFFIAHVTVRQYDSNLNYKRLAVLNQNLEAAVQERTRALENANRALSELSVRDPLTNAFNRLYLEQILERRIAQAERDGTVFHCCMFDLDYFKKINDTFGHDVGDEQLISAVRTVEGIIDDKCILTRVGGEEFVILFFERTDEEVVAVVQRIRAALEAMAKDSDKRTTASFGLVRYEYGMHMKDLMKGADLALYRAKSAGRNRLECALDSSFFVPTGEA